MHGLHAARSTGHGTKPGVPTIYEQGLLSVHTTRSGSESLLNVSNLRQTTKTTQYGSDYPEPALPLYHSEPALRWHRGAKVFLFMEQESHSSGVNIRAFRFCSSPQRLFRVKKQNGKVGRTRRAFQWPLIRPLTSSWVSPRTLWASFPPLVALSSGWL